MATQKLVLVVDYDRETCNLVARTLSGRGYVTLCANGCAEALNLTRLYRFDLLITRVTMDASSGLDLAADMLCANPRLRVLYMSRADDPVRVYSALHAGSDALLNPFKEEELVRKTNALLHARRGPAGHSRRASRA